LLYQSGDSLVDLIMDSNRPNSGQTIGRTRFYWNSDEVARIEGLTGTDTTNKDDGRIRFLTQTSGDTTLSEAMRIDENQRVLIGATQNFAKREKEILLISNTGGGSIAMRRDDASITEGNDLGNLVFYSADGSTPGTDGEVAQINVSADGTHGTGSYPGRIQLWTTADGAATPTERMRISQNGFVNIGGQRTADESLVELNKSGSNTVGEGHIGFAGGADPLWAFRFDNSDFNFRFDRAYGGWTSTPALSVRRSNGYVGLGVDTASYQLDVQNSANTFSRILATGNNTRAAFLAQSHLSDGTDISMNMGVYGDANQGEISMATGHPLLLYTNNDPTKGVELQVDGDLNIKDGNLVVASGHGIDFSATSGTGTSELLDDYEEGTFTVQDNNIGEYTDSYGRYTKIGNMVHCFGYFTVPSTSNANIADIYLPFTFGYYAQSHTIGTVLSNETGNYYLKTSGSTTMAIVDQDESQQTLADFSTKTVRFNVTFHVA
jgi:hypothetical protein